MQNFIQHHNQHTNTEVGHRTSLSPRFQMLPFYTQTYPFNSHLFWKDFHFHLHNLLFLALSLMTPSVLRVMEYQLLVCGL